MKIKIKSKPIERIKTTVNVQPIKSKENIFLIKGEKRLPIRIVQRIIEGDLFGHYFFYQAMRIGGGYFSI